MKEEYLIMLIWFLCYFLCHGDFYEKCKKKKKSVIINCLQYYFSSKGNFALTSGNIWQYLKTFLVDATGIYWEDTKVVVKHPILCGTATPNKELSSKVKHQ